MELTDGTSVQSNYTNEEAIQALTKNSMARRIQRGWRLSARSFGEIKRGVAWRCVQAIANLNWKYFGSGNYQGHAEETYSEETAFIIANFDPYDDVCAYLSKRSEMLGIGYYRSCVEDEWNDKISVFHLAYLEATCYLSQDLTCDDLLASWNGTPSPWLDNILAKTGRQMSDWEFYPCDDEEVPTDVDAATASIVAAVEEKSETADGVN